MLFTRAILKDLVRLKVNRWKNISVANNKPTIRIAVLISDKIDIKANSIERERRMFHNDKKANCLERQNYKCVCT